MSAATRPPFSSIALSPPLQRAVTELGWVGMTPIQARVIPLIQQGYDVHASAETGSGKTAAFMLPLLDRLHATSASRPRRVRALVLVPTRELSLQIAEVTLQLGRYLDDVPKIVAVFGGASVNPQMMALRGGADVVVATPGRLLDLVDRHALDLSFVEALVLDEADRLLSLGFADELARILALVPTTRQSLLFSATFPAAVRSLAERLLRDPHRVDAGSQRDSGDTLTQRAIAVDASRRVPLLLRLLEDPTLTRVLVFAATKTGADALALALGDAGVSAAPLHGDLSQGRRTATLADFKTKRVRVVVATDVAARGLDVVALSCVVNFDLPRSSTDYLHRIGRTGRAGRTGMAISFVGAADEAHFRVIERQCRVSVPREQVEGFERTDTAVAPPNVGGVKGKRKSKKDKLREAAATALCANIGDDE